MNRRSRTDDRIIFWLILWIFGPMAFGSCGSCAKAQGFIVKKDGKAGRNTAPVVVPRKGPPKFLKSIDVRQGTEVTRFDATAGVEKIDVFSNHIRVTFYVHYTGRERISIDVNTKTTSLVDPDGETYLPIGRDPNPAQAYRRDISPGSKIRFFLDYPLPAVTTTAFKVNLLMNGGFAMAETMFPPFDIELPTHVGPDPVEPEIDLEKEKTGPKAKDPAPVPPGTGGDEPPPKEAPKAASKVSVIYEGNVTIPGKPGATVGIEFTALPEEGRPLAARMFSTRQPSLCGPLTGHVIEEPSTREGVAFVLLDRTGTSIKLLPDGKQLCGTSSTGMKFTLKRVEPKRSAKGK